MEKLTIPTSQELFSSLNDHNYKYLMKIEISCDEYIPEFLYGKLNNCYLYLDYKRPVFEAKMIFDHFIKWMIEDPSCTSAPIYQTRVPKDVDTFNELYKEWFCNIDNGNAWFKITIIKRG